MQQSFLEKANKLNELAVTLGITMAQLSIGWVINNLNVTTAILGATNKDQLMGNLGAIDAKSKLNAEVMEMIEAIVGTKPVLPEY
jgi:aryl-alcohol dehydrogenase-like predicted oxidoreductase